jgi:hypothetical protein
VLRGTTHRSVTFLDVVLLLTASILFRADGKAVVLQQQLQNHFVAELVADQRFQVHSVDVASERHRR